MQSIQQAYNWAVETCAAEIYDIIREKLAAPQ